MRDRNTILQKTESVTWHSIPTLPVFRMSVFHMPHSGKELFQHTLLWLHSVWLHLGEFNFMQSFQVMFTSDRRKFRYPKTALRSSGKMKATRVAKVWSELCPALELAVKNWESCHVGDSWCLEHNGMKDDLVGLGAYIMDIKGNGNEKWMSEI